MTKTIEATQESARYLYAYSTRKKINDNVSMARVTVTDRRTKQVVEIWETQWPNRHIALRRVKEWIAQHRVRVRIESLGAIHG